VVVVLVNYYPVHHTCCTKLFLLPVIQLHRFETRSVSRHSITRTLFLIHEMRSVRGRLQHTSAAANHHETKQRCHVPNFPRSTTLTAWQDTCGNAVHAQRSSTQYTHSSWPIKERRAYITSKLLSRSLHSLPFSLYLSLSPSLITAALLRQGGRYYGIRRARDLLLLLLVAKGDVEIERVFKREGNMTLSEQGEKNLRSPLLADSGNGGCNGMFCQYSTGGEAKAAEVRESERDN
jgi:hypothetical protein